MTASTKTAAKDRQVIRRGIINGKDAHQSQMCQHAGKQPIPVFPQNLPHADEGNIPQQPSRDEHPGDQRQFRTRGFYDPPR